MKPDDQRLLGIDTMTPVPAADRGQFATDGVVLERRERSLWRKTRFVTSVVLRDPAFVIDPDTGNS